MYQRRNYGVVNPAFGGLFENILHNGWNRVQEEVNSLSVPANITENEKSIDLDLVAPGLKKEEFKISIDKNILTVSYEHKDEAKEQESVKALRTEYNFKSFKRSFTLNEKIDTTNITARYADGILHITLSKKENVEAPAKEIVIN